MYSKIKSVMSNYGWDEISKETRFKELRTKSVELLVEKFPGKTESFF